MAADTFDRVMDAVIFPSEGGYVNHPRDPGGPTNFGITKATLEASRRRRVSIEEVKALPKAEAREIYRKSYARHIRYDELPAGLDCCILDFAVNSGSGRAVKTLQAVMGMPQSGVMDLKTLAAVLEREADRLVNAVCDRRLSFLRRLKTWSTFGKGWSRRVESVRRTSIKMVDTNGHAVRMTPVADASADEGSRKALPTDTKLTATTHGQGAITVAAGAATSAIGEAKSAIEPYIGLHEVVQYAFVAMQVLGVVVLAVGLAVLVFAELRRIKSGAPV